MHYRALLGSLGALSTFAGCAASTDDPLPLPAAATEQPDAWNPHSEDPSRILSGASTKLADLVSAADVGKEFGVDDEHIPYPDTYWPYLAGGTDVRWNGYYAPSPLEKAMLVLAPNRLGHAKSWEYSHHGTGVLNAETWWGHCPGWTGAAMFNKPILHRVAVRQHQGEITACTPGERGCVTFEIGDINALEAEVFVDGNTQFLGARCDLRPEEVRRDRYGRIARDGTGCRGLNAGSLLVVLGNRLRRDRQPIAIDAQTAFTTDQIWNQPAYRYVVNGYRPLSKEDAIALVLGRLRIAGWHDYVWNRRAKGFVRVDLTLKWVREHGPNRMVVSGKHSTRLTRIAAIIELDAEPSDPDANVIGGEYIDSPRAGADRLTVPPFVWLVHGPGPEDLGPSTPSNHHNPYVRPSFVQKLVELGTTPAAPERVPSEPQTEWAAAPTYRPLPPVRPGPMWSPGPTWMPRSPWGFPSNEPGWNAGPSLSPGWGGGSPWGMPGMGAPPGFGGEPFGPGGEPN